MWMMNRSASAFCSRDAARIADGRDEFLERGDGIALGRGHTDVIGLAGGHGDVVIRPGFLLPEGVGVRPFEVGPGRRLGDALDPEDAADFAAGVPGDEARGDRADDAVAGLAPRERRGRSEGKAQGE